MKLRFIFLFVAALFAGTLSAQVTIFSENMGTPTGTTSIAANNFQNEPLLTYSGTADVRKTNPSPLGSYTGASNNGNVFFTNNGSASFQIENINTIGITGMTLSFGMNKSTTVSNGSELIVEVSTNGSVYTPLTFTPLPTGSGTAGGTDWYLRTMTSGTIPSTVNLRIRFRQTVTTNNYQFRIDDVTLYGTPTISLANLQFPGSATINIGDNLDVYSRVKAENYTTYYNGQPDMEAEIGYSLTDSDPSGGGWTWITATYNSQFGNDDEYKLDLGAQIPAAGTYYYASRFRIATGAYQYGGYNIGGGGIWNGTTNVNGVLNVINPQVDFANVQSPATGTFTAGGNYWVFARVYEPGVTEAAGAGPGITAWIGYNTANTDPSTAGWTWVPATFNLQYDNDDEWMADIGAGLTINGNYYYASRFQLGSGTYSYGGTNSNATPGGNFWNGTTYISGVVTVSGASNATDYYQSKSSGFWSATSSWQSSPDNATWSNATQTPTSAAAGINIRNGHTITSNASVTADDIVIAATGKLIVSAGTFTLNDGLAANDLQVNGTFENRAGTFTQNGAITVAGTYLHSTSNTTLALATWTSGSTCKVTGFTNSSAVTIGNAGQGFYNFTWDCNQGFYANIENIGFSVANVMTVGPTGNNMLSFSNTSGTKSFTVGKLVVSSGELEVVGNNGTVNFTVTDDVEISDIGFLALSGGSGTANVTVGGNLNISDDGWVTLINANNCPSQVLTIDGNLSITGNYTAQLRLENASSTGAATVNVLGDLNCLRSDDYFNYFPIDFGSMNVTNNVLNIAGNLNKTGDGIFSSTSNNVSKGVVFNGSGAIQTFKDTGLYISNKANFTVQSGAKLQLLTDHYIGTGTSPVSQFLVENGATLNFGLYSIYAGNGSSKFVTQSNATLETSNSGGFGGTGLSGSLRNFAASKISLVQDVNYTLNGNTTAPFPNVTFGDPGTVLINADVTSNIAGNINIRNLFKVASTGKMKMNVSGLNNLTLNNGSASFFVDTNGVFDNNGENRIIKGSGTPSATINGKFITRDAQGFSNSSGAAISYGTAPAMTITLGPDSTVEYALNGNQIVTGLTSPLYQNVIFSNGGTKTLASKNEAIGTITVKDNVIFDAVNFQFGSGTSNLVMTGTATYKTGGADTKPDSATPYALGSGTTIEFYSPTTAATNPRKASVDYANVVISGNNIVNTGVTGLEFQPGGTFTVRNNAIFKIENPAGFTGSTSTAIEPVNSPTIVLEPGSTIEYSAAADQTITPFLPNYSNLNISGTGIKSFAFTSEILVGEDLTVSAATLQIDPDVTMTVTDAVLNTGGTIDIKNAGSLVQITDVDNATANNNSGNIRMARDAENMYRYDYTYWSSPVTESSNFTIHDVSPATLFDKYFKYDAPTQAWQGIPNGNENMISGVGYIARAPNTFPTNPALTFPFSTQFIGKPNNGTITVPVTGSSSAVVADHKFNLLGNPYPSAIFADTFVTANPNLWGSLYFWTHNTAISTVPVNGTYNYFTADYAMYNQSGSTAATSGGPVPSGKIAAGQGFFVRGISDVASDAVFDNTMRIAGQNSQFFRMAGGNQNATTSAIERHRVWLNLTSQQAGFSQNLTAYVEGATNGLDRLFDGELLGGDVLALYSVVDESMLTIQGRVLPFDVNDKVPLGYRTATAGPLQIAMDHFDGLFEYQNVYLEDKLLNIIHDIKQSPYNFVSEAGTFNQRFQLRYTTTSLSVANFDATLFAVTVKDKKINVYSKKSDIVKIVIFDLLGRQLFEAIDINAGTYSTSNVTMSDQVLIVKSTLADGSIINTKIQY